MCVVAEADLQLHTSQEHSDQPLLEHVRELITKLDVMGIKLAGAGEDEEAWDDVEHTDSDPDVDVDMG